MDNYIEIIKAASEKNEKEILRLSKILGFFTGEENEIMK